MINPCVTNSHKNVLEVFPISTKTLKNEFKSKQISRVLTASPQKQCNFLSIHTVRLVKLRVHAELQFSPQGGGGGGRSSSSLNYMLSPSMKHSSPRQPAFTLSPCQHQCGLLPSTGESRTRETTVSSHFLHAGRTCM